MKSEYVVSYSYNDDMIISSCLIVIQIQTVLMSFRGRMKKLVVNYWRRLQSRIRWLR